MCRDRQVVPFREFVLKVHSRCDLACDHCYVYEHADQSWRAQPRHMSEATAARTASRIAEHAAAHRLPAVSIVLHGGEPLLLGLDRTRRLLERLLATVGEATRPDLRIHTNGVRLDTAFLDLFAEYDVGIGVSLDGDRAANDLHRLFPNRTSSHAKVLRALELLRRPDYRRLYSGILCTIDVRNDPVATYDALAAQQPPRIDLLLPHATWENPPPRLDATRDEYAAWLTAVFDRWNARGRPFGIRTFDSVLAVLRGGPSQTESLGLDAADVLVIETDGGLQQADSLKTAYDGAPATGYNVFDHSFEQAAAHAGIRARQTGIDGLCPTCLACPVVSVCGGGLYAHRFHRNSFDHPSVYCRDLKSMIEHLEKADAAAPPPAAVAVVAAAPDAGPSGSHGLSSDDLDLLGSGLGGEETLRRLGEAQCSIRRSLISVLFSAVPGDDPVATTARDLLIELDSSAPGAVETVLAYPYARAWASDCLADLNAGRPAGDGFARLGPLAASAALHAGVAADLPLRTATGTIHLPTLGTLTVPDGASRADRAARILVRPDRTATVLVDGGRHAVGRASDRGFSPAWSARRHLESRALSAWIEDGDPLRDRHRWAAAPALSDHEFSRWRRGFAAAVMFLEEALPHYLPGLRGGLDTITPLAAAADGSSVSSTVRHAYGAVAAALPPDGPALALLLAHEFQHVKLGAVLDMYDLFDPDDRRLYHAPWRDDPRPLEGLLQGAYAHLAVTDYWRVRRLTAPRAESSTAEAQFARWRADTADSIDTLLGSGSLTALGARFVRAMAQTAHTWGHEPVSEEALVTAQRAARRHQAARGAGQAVR